MVISNKVSNNDFRSHYCWSQCRCSDRVIVWGRYGEYTVYCIIIISFYGQHDLEMKYRALPIMQQEIYKRNLQHYLRFSCLEGWGEWGAMDRRVPWTVPYLGCYDLLYNIFFHMTWCSFMRRWERVKKFTDNLFIEGIKLIFRFYTV